MITLSEGIDLCFKLIPTVQAFAIQKYKNERDDKIDDFKRNSIEKLEEKTGHMSKPSGQNQPKVKLPEGWQEGETVEKLGHRYWTGYHAAVDSLPEDASPDQVKKMLQQIEKNARAFPCPSCRENATEILDTKSLDAGEIETKKDAQMALCNFHNAVSDHVGNKTVNCEKTYAA